jgi:hypothetical protein
MNAVLTVLNSFKYPLKSWTYAKILTMAVWLGFLLQELSVHHTAPTPVGICRCLDCNTLVSAPYTYLVAAAAVILSVFYVFEIYMPVTILLLAFMGMVVFSVAASDGSRPRVEILSAVLIVQWAAYIQHRLSNSKFKAAVAPRGLAMFYSIQIIAACYTISAIRKMQVSHFDWIMHAPYVTLKVLASFTSRGLDFNMPWLIPCGQWIAHAIMNHPQIIRAGFTMVFLIEFFAVAAVWGRRQARCYGFLLLVMHFFMLLVMGIVILPFVLLVIGYLVNFKQPETHAAASPVQAGSNSLGPVLYRLALPAVFITASLFIGEQHPFSRFPMFSTMDNFARYYWLQDQNGKAVSSRNCFNVRGDQFKNLIGDRAIIHQVDLKNSEALKPICAPLMQHLVATHQAGLKAQNISEIKLMDHWLWIDSGQVKQRDIVLADVRVDTLAK